MARSVRIAAKLSGIVEADEVYIGGKPRRRKPVGSRPRGIVAKKTQVAVLVQRDGGPARVRVFPYDLTGPGLKRFIRGKPLAMPDSGGGPSSLTVPNALNSTTTEAPRECRTPAAEP